MKAQRVLRLLCGSAILYVAIAACGAGSTVATSEDGELDASGLIDAFVDALVDEVSTPTKDAKADPLPPEVAEEPCNKTAPQGGSTAKYAEHAYPNASEAELSAVRALATVETSAFKLPGYTKQNVPTWVRDGAVAVYCGTTSAASYTSVTFIRPK